MNNNFTHKDLKSFDSKFSGFLSILTILSAAHWFAVNFLLAPYQGLLRLPAISGSAISEFFNGNKLQPKPKPVYVSNASYSFKKLINS